MKYGGDIIVKIVTPINNIKEVHELIKEGAGEFYFGYLDPDWMQYYGAYSGNRRENYLANFIDISSVKEVSQLLASQGIEGAITFNDRYTDSQYSLLKEILHKIEEAGITNVIVADIGLIQMIRKWAFSFNIHVSTGGGVMNHSAVKFYLDHGAKRIIFPRQLTIEEMNQMTLMFSGVEFEVFGMYGRDPYIDAFCRFHHGINSVIPGLGSCGCIRLNNSAIMNKEDDAISNGNPYRCLNSLNVDGCAACALYGLDRAKINYIKIVGRGSKTERKVKAVRMIKKSLEELENFKTYSDYEKHCKKIFKENFNVSCIKNNCYFNI